MSNKRNFILGSGDLYAMEYTGVIPEDSVIETEANRYGYVKGGATLAYTPETEAIGDDLGYVKETILKSEEVLFKTGLMQKSTGFLSKLCGTAEQTEDENGVTTKLGGLGNDNGKAYLLRFVGAGRAKGIRVTVVGTCSSGFEMAFAPDAATVVDVEFSAQPLDDKGHLAIVEDQAEAAQQ